MSPAHEHVELKGSIRQFSLPDIVQFLSAASKTGRLALLDASSGDRGAIYFAEGIVLHAESGEKEGEEAFFELVRLREGSFDFFPDETTDRKSVDKHSALLLMEGARRNDEWDMLSEEIPDTRLVPEFVAPDDHQTGKQITLNTSEWMVLTRIDGERSLKDISRLAGLSEYHCCRLLYPLVRNGLIRLREPSR